MYGPVRLDDMRVFLSNPDSYGPFLTYAVSVDSVSELLAWRVVQHFKARTVSAAVVYAVCLAPGAVLATPAAGSLRPRVAAAMTRKSGASDVVDHLLEAFADKLLRALIADVLPGYREATPTWDTFVHRSVIRRDCSTLGPPLLAKNPSVVALRDASELDTNASRPSDRSMSGKLHRLGDVVTATALGIKPEQRKVPVLWAAMDDDTRTPALSTKSIVLNP
ncbi:hypothetical protein ACHHYP_20333 [Achlya hypogyna]|uniref:Uncharacterized protein n=1 Tax=Achlya hypogyna TaxID=1202772 RepID=A0A1V9YQS2_ACHHY|nr:hypothetical protein ACHHYP_20333 [Achlya hypogyna]